MTAKDDIILSVVIPVFNEEKTIVHVLDEHLRELRSLGSLLKDWEIVCLNDASTDRSEVLIQEVVRREGKVRFLRHETNQGISASFAHLFQEARGTHIYLTAGDDQWPAENMRRLLERLRETNSDLVIGVRQNRQQVYTPWRRFLSYAFNAIPKIIFKIDAKDANGIKLGRREIFAIPLRSRSFFAEIERLIMAQKKGYVITSAAIAFKHRSGGKARGAAWRNIMATVRDMAGFLILGGASKAT